VAKQQCFSARYARYSTYDFTSVVGERQVLDMEEHYFRITLKSAVRDHRRLLFQFEKHLLFKADRYYP
jgi:hypothetical protein